MHILFLGTSNDTLRPPGSRVSRAERVRELLEENLGQQVTITLREAWPTPALPDALDRWLTREEPDLLYISVNGYWYLYDSVPLRLRHRWGRVGALVAGLSERAGRSERLSWNAPFRFTRAVAERLIGADANFTPEEVVMRVEDCIRVGARREGLIIAVRPSWGDVSYARNPAGAERKEQLRLAVQRAVAGVCDRYHAYCEITERAHWQDHPNRVEAAGDGIHQGLNGLEFTARALADSILRAMASAPDVRPDHEGGARQSPTSRV